MVPAACGTVSSTEPALDCGVGDVIDGRPLRIAVTIAPIASIVANIAGGSGAAISGIVPEGTDSHTFEPTPSAAAAIEDADVVFVNGLQLEEPIKNLALANLRDGAEVCELGTSVLAEKDYIYDFAYPESAGRPNPHLWTSPPMGKQYAALVRDTLIARDPQNADLYGVNYVNFAAKIDLLDAALRTATETVPSEQRQLLTYHDAYAYFAVEYGWTVVGAIQPSSFDEPTPREVADLIDTVNETGVPAIFGSEVFPSTVLQRISDETGAAYVDDLRDDDLPGVPGDPDHSWLALMQYNATTIVSALGGDASEIEALDVADIAADTATYAQ